MTLSTNVAALFEQSREVVTYVEVYPDRARDAIHAYLGEMVPALRTGSFCPEGREFDTRRAYGPVVALVLGDPEYNGQRVRIEADWYDVALRYGEHDGLSYDAESDTWTLLVKTNWWSSGVGAPRTMRVEKVSVPIPGAVMRELGALVRGDHKEVWVVWHW